MKSLPHRYESGKIFSLKSVFISSFLTGSKFSVKHLLDKTLATTVNIGILESK